MTLRELAQTVGISEGHLSRVEAGTRGLKTAKLDLLFKVLGVSANDHTIEKTEFVSDLVPYHPPKESVIERALTSSSQRLFRVLSDVLSEININNGNLIVVETAEHAIQAIRNGAPVVASGLGNGTEEMLILRQYLAPSLLITNRVEQNAMPLHMIRSNIRILGVVLM